MNVGFRIPKSVDTESPGHAVDLRQYLNFAWRYWMFIASVTAFALLIAVIYLVRATPLYTATTQVLLEQREKAPGLASVVGDDGTDTDLYVENQLAILRSNSLLRRVVIKEQLAQPSTNQTQSVAHNENEVETTIIDRIGRLRNSTAAKRHQSETAEYKRQAIHSQ